MESARWRRVEELFDRASELGGIARAELLARECGADRGLYDEVASLLANANTADSDLRGAVAAAVSSLANGESDRAVGTCLGPYRLLEPIGEGGMGTVFLAERDDAQYRRRVAIKVMRDEVVSPQLVSRFRDERQILATLDHPAIVRLLDGGSTEAGLPYLVMEHVAGTGFSAYVKQMSVHARVELVVRVAAAVQYAHQRLIVHRDLKPSNILVTADGAPKLLDFGIAKLLADDGGGREAKTRTGVALLTPEYASPEQARGEPVTVATDVYSLGAVLYSALVGTPPQRAGGSALETLRIICEVEPPRPSSVAPAGLRREIAGDLDSIVLKALHKRPERRYPSVAALIEDLERYLRGMPVEARDATFTYRARKTIARNRGKLAIAAAVAVALSTATAVSILQARRADARAAEARAQNVALMRERGLQELAGGHGGRALPFLVEALKDGDDTGALRLALAQATRPYERRIATLAYPQGVYEFAISPDGSRIAVILSGGQLDVLDHEGHVVATGTTTPTRHDVPVFSPDGRYIATLSDAAKQVNVWETAVGGHARELAGPFASPLAGIPQIAHLEFIDATKLLAMSGDGTFIVWDLARGTRDVTSRHRVLRRALIGPDRTTIALVGPGGEVEIESLATHETLAAMQHGDLFYSTAWLADGTLLTGSESHLRAWRPDGQPLWSVPGIQIASYPIEVSGDLVLTGGDLRLWDARTGALRAQLVGHRGIATGKFSADRKRIVSVGLDNTFRVWDAATGAELESIESGVGGGLAANSRGGIVDANVTRGGEVLVTAWSTGVTLWKLGGDDGHRIYPVTGESFTAAPSPDETRIVAAGRGKVFDVRELPSGKVLKTIDVFGDGAFNLWHVDWRPDGQRFLAVGAHGFARIYDRDGNEVRRLPARETVLNGGSYSPDGKRIVTAGTDGEVHMYDGESGDELAVLRHPKPAMWGAWSPDGSHLATTCADGKLRIWDTATMDVVREIDAGKVSLLSAAYSPDGKHLTSTGHGGEADIWNAATGEHERSLLGHSQPIPQASWSHDGELIATCSSDGSARIWDARTGKELMQLRTQPEVMEVVWSLDDRRLYTTSTTTGLEVWPVPRETRSVEELEAFTAEYTPFRLVDGQLESIEQRR